MGFFSSRKAEPTPLSPAERASSVKVIRSRFYGKGRNNALNKNAASSPCLPPQTPQPSSKQQRRDSMQYITQSTPIGQARQVSTDALTMSLAERLNDLAAANADGLLDDEEYRLLRQNLFERYAAGSELPSEIPVLPMTRGKSTRVDSERRIPSRAPSIDSQRSIATAVSSFFRRATGRSSSSITSPDVSISGSKYSLDQLTSPITAEHDTSSIYSRPSISSNYPYSRSVSRRPSNDSLLSLSQAGSVSASVTHDIRGLISRQQVLGPNYASSISSRVTTRSTKPPSSFHLRHHPASSQFPVRTHEGDDDDDSPKSAAELRLEIEIVECEGRKLLDAFNSLELSALTKPRQTMSMGVVGRLRVYPDEQQLSVYSELPSSSLGSSYTVMPDRTQSIPLVSQPVNLKKKPSVVTTIAGSFKSSTSGGFMSSSSTSASVSASTSTSISTSNGYLSTTSPSLLYSSRSSPNLNSAASTSSSPTIPALPIATTAKKRPSILRPSKRPVVLPPALAAATATANTSTNAPLKASYSNKLSLTSPSKLSIVSKAPSVSDTSPTSPLRQHTFPLSLTKPAAPLSPAKRSGLDPALRILEAELGEIRRRRTEVALRYEQRLDYLRAKLKTAEIREKLTRR